MLSHLFEESREMTTTRRFGATLYDSEGQLYTIIGNNTGFRIVKN